MQSPAKLTVDLDANTAARLEVERARIAAETGLPRVSLAGTVAAVLRRALPDAEATTTRRPKSQEARA